MRRQIVLTRAIRVGIVAVAASDELLSNVGPAAWESSGGLALEQALPEDAFVVIRALVVHGGKQREVAQLLMDWSEAPNRNARCDLIFTLGGDALAPRDVVPDATLQAIEREIPGLADILRQGAGASRSASDVSSASPIALSRATAGYRRQTLIINIPGSFARPGDAVRLLLPVLPEALKSLGVHAFDPSRAGRIVSP